MDRQPYVVLRALLPDEPTPPPGVRTRHASPTDRGATRLRVEMEELKSEEARRLHQEHGVLAMAPPMPMRLIAPRDKAAAAIDHDEPVPWGIRAVGADACTWTAEQIAVAVLDTGIDRTHDVFADMAIEESDFTGTGMGDTDGHGTHCAATIFGQTVGGVRCGVAPSIGKALVAKVLDDDRAGTTDSLARAVIWALQSRANIISMSLGLDFVGYVRSLVDLDLPVELATSKALEAYRENLRFFDKLADLVTSAGPFGPGALLIAAGGNESDRDATPALEIGVAPPAVASGVISVAALQREKPGSDLMTVASFSNTGPLVAAPGVAIRSARAGGGYVSMSGTSMAAPHVAGVAALWVAKMLSEEARFDPRMVANRLIGTTRRYAGWQSADIGTGLVQAPPSP